MSPIKQNYKKGICDECDGNVQESGGVYYCMDCKKNWAKDSWNNLVQSDKEMDYEVPDYYDNMSGLNSL